MDRSSLKDLTYAAARRIAVVVIGTTLLGVALVLVFTPGPAIVVLGVALAVFAIEFTWARRWLRKLKSAARAAAGVEVRVREGGAHGEPDAGEGPRPEG